MKWIVYLNGIGWDNVKAPDKRTAIKRAKDLVKKQFSRPALKGNEDMPKKVTVESEEDFIG